MSAATTNISPSLLPTPPALGMVWTRNRLVPQRTYDINGYLAFWGAHGRLAMSLPGVCITCVPPMMFPTFPARWATMS